MATGRPTDPDFADNPESANEHGLPEIAVPDGRGLSQENARQRVTLHRRRLEYLLLPGQSYHGGLILSVLAVTGEVEDPQFGAHHLHLWLLLLHRSHQANFARNTSFLVR